MSPLTNEWRNNDCSPISTEFVEKRENSGVDMTSTRTALSMTD